MRPSNSGNSTIEDPFHHSEDRSSSPTSPVPGLSHQNSSVNGFPKLFGALPSDGQLKDHMDVLNNSFSNNQKEMLWTKERPGPIVNRDLLENPPKLSSLHSNTPKQTDGSSPSTTEDVEENHEEKTKKPVKVFSPELLGEPDCYFVSQNDPRAVELRPGLNEEKHFTVVHERVWEFLSEKYGFDYVIRRRAVAENHPSNFGSQNLRMFSGSARSSPKEGGVYHYLLLIYYIIIIYFY